MRESDPHLAAKADQDPEAFTALYEQYVTRVFTYFQYRCNDSATAQDLTMQVFERLLRCLPSYDENRAPIAAWLFAIVRHVAADWQRRQYLRKFVPWEHFDQRPSPGPGPEQIAVEREERRHLRRALARLSNRERDLIGLRFSSGLTNRAIAEMAGLSESNVAVILYRALQKLRTSLAENTEKLCPNATPWTEVDHE